MRRFRFKMQTVLDLRQREEDAARVELLQAERQLEASQSALQQLIARQNEHRKAMARIGRTVNRSDEMSDLFHFSQMLAVQIQDQNRHLAQAERRVEAQRDRLREIAQARRILEALKEKDQERWRQENLRLEQAFLDELGNTAHQRRSERGGTATQALVLLGALILAAGILVGVTQVVRYLEQKYARDLEPQPLSLASDTAPGDTAPADAGDTSDSGEAPTGPAPTPYSVEGIDPPDLSSVPSIREERDRINNKIAELSRWEQRIQEMEREIREERREIDQKREAVEALVQRYETLKREVEHLQRLSLDQRTDDLAKVYNGMDAAVVADFLLGKPDNDAVVAILAKMQPFAAQEVIQSMAKKDKNRASQVLDAWTAARGAAR